MHPARYAEQGRASTSWGTSRSVLYTPSLDDTLGQTHGGWGRSNRRQLGPTVLMGPTSVTLGEASPRTICGAFFEVMHIPVLQGRARACVAGCAIIAR